MVRSLADQLETTEDGEVRIRYYSAVNRISAVALRLLDGDRALPAGLRMGCVFDVLTAINRSDLLFTSVLTLLHVESRESEGSEGSGESGKRGNQRGVDGETNGETNGETEEGNQGEESTASKSGNSGNSGNSGTSGSEELSTHLFFAVLLDYIACGRLSQIPPSSLAAFLQFIEETQSPATCFAIEQRLVKLQFASDLDAVLQTLFSRGFLLAGAAISINSRADFVRPLQATFAALNETPRAFHAFYPDVLGGSVSPAGLTSFYLFLLHLALLGFNLGNAPLNSLGRITSQSDCLAWLVTDTPRGNPFDRLLARQPAFFLGLLFYALSVKAVLPAGRQSIPAGEDGGSPGSGGTAGEEESEEEGAHVAAEAEAYRGLYEAMASTIARGLLRAHSRGIGEGETQLAMFHVIASVLREQRVEGVTVETVETIVEFLAKHTALLRREEWKPILANLPISRGSAPRIAALLLEIGCVDETVEAFHRCGLHDQVFRLFFSQIRSSPRDAPAVARRIEQYLAAVFSSSRGVSSRRSRRFSRISAGICDRWRSAWNRISGR